MSEVNFGRRMERPRHCSRKCGAAPAVVGGDVLIDELNLELMKTLDKLGCGSFIACNGRYEEHESLHVRIDKRMQFWMYRNRSLHDGGEAE
jgi:hypothetical protein